MKQVMKMLKIYKKTTDEQIVKHNEQTHTEHK